MKTHPRGSDLPDYARQILAFRKRLQMTQPQLAEALKMKRGAIAQWEGGVREPKLDSYVELTELASQRGLSDFLTFFGAQMGRKMDQALERREKKRGRLILADMRRRAAAGDEKAKHLLELSEMDHLTFHRLEDERLAEAKRRLENGEYAVFSDEIAEERYHVAALRLGRQSAIEEGLKRTERRAHKVKRHK
jgi:transcriptional regulator with XRE-family HTH domain